MPNPKPAQSAGVYLSKREYASHFSLSIATVQRMIDRGEVAALRLGGVWRIPRSEVDRREALLPKPQGLHLTTRAQQRAARAMKANSAYANAVAVLDPLSEPIDFSIPDADHDFDDDPEFWGDANAFDDDPEFWGDANAFDDVNQP